MASPADELQKVFKTLSDPTRVRILWLLEQEELVVQELEEVLAMAQSRVSRHLAILREAGLLQDRREGTYVSYRFVPPASGSWRDAWSWVAKNLEHDPTIERDAAMLERVVDARSGRSGSFFDAVGPEWDAVRKVFNDDALRARAISRLVEPGHKVADIGTGTGVLAIELAELGLQVIGLDSSQAMLDAARAKLEQKGLENVELRLGEAHELPFVDGEVRASFAHMVLQYLPSPAAAVAEMARIVVPGGAVVLADFVAHDQEWMRADLGVRWLGFEPDEVLAWLEGAGLEQPRLEVYPAPGRGSNLPETFVVSARRTAS